MVITVCSGKGGSGKTTVAVLLAACLAEAGKRVAILDTDPQQTATAWLREASGGRVAFYHPGAKYDAVLIDTPPRLEALPAALAGCDVAVIPCQPSPMDLWSTVATAAAVRPALPKGARLRLLFNSVRPGTILSRDLPALAGRIGVEALKATISRRQCIQHAALAGWPALDRAAKEEIYAAATEIIGA